jgi:folate-binding protein YgfZ
VFPRSAGPALANDLKGGAGARWGTAAELEHLRVTAGIPAVPAEVGPADLPNEGGLDAAAVSYTKGCYVGQEVMARVKATGRIRRRLIRVRGAAPPPSVPAALWREGRQVGELRSASCVPGEAGFIGLALVSRAGAEPAGPWAWSDGGDAAVEVLDVGLH